MTRVGGATLRAISVSCAVGGRTVLREVELALRPGEVLGVLGPNGSGKSTLLRVLAGVLPPAQGQVLVDGFPLDRMSARRRARAVALVGQQEQWPAELRVGELVALGRLPHQPPWGGGHDPRDRAAVREALQLVDMLDMIDRPVEQLSGGERRRALLAKGLAQQAPLLMLDEPTNHLDVRHQFALLELIKKLVKQRNRTAVLAMHDLNLALRACDRLVVLHGGHARPPSPPSEALTPEAVFEVFGVHAVPITHPFTGQSHLLLSGAPDDPDRPEDR